MSEEKKQLPAVMNDDAIMAVVMRGDLGKLTDEQAVKYYQMKCSELGLNWVTQPYDYLVLKGKKVLYLNSKGCAQFNQLHGISHQIVDKGLTPEGDIYFVTARASKSDGSYQEATKYVPYPAKGSPEERCNAMMKAETGAKMRSTKQLSGEAGIDETEIDLIPGAVAVEGPKPTAKEVKAVAPAKKAAKPEPEKKEEAEEEVTDVEGVTAETEALEVFLHGLGDATGPAPVTVATALMKFAEEQGWTREQANMSVMMPKFDVSKATFATKFTYEVAAKAAHIFATEQPH